MPGAFLGVGHGRAGSGVEVAPQRRIDGGVRAGGQQRMGEAHAPIAHGDHVRPLGLVQRTMAVARHRLHQPDGRLRQGRCGGERAARLGGQRLQAGAHELIERQRQRLARLELDGAGL